jgi:hypothetical protein
MGSLSSAQAADVCSLVLNTIDAPAGTKYECNEGEHSGVSLTVNTKEQCLASLPPKTCTLKVGTLVDCYKAVKKDACAAFDAECSFLFDSSNGCSK